LWCRACPCFRWRTSSQEKRGGISQKKVTLFLFRRREENYLKAKELLDTGDEEGYKKMAESIDISPDMAYHLIIQLKANNIEFIVAPYEADAQLAYLCRTGYVDFILTEDSDLLAFGAPKVLYKFDFINFIGQEVCLNNIKRIKDVQFNWFTHNMFLTTCILSGCDYLGQLSGIGIKKAQKIISRVSTFKRFIEEMSSENIPADYEENFMKAFLTFRFQRVYCPKRKMCVEVNERNFGMNVE
jgi:exonuclease-1